MKHGKYTNILQNVTLKKYKMFSNLRKKLLILWLLTKMTCHGNETVLQKNHINLG